MKIKFLGAAGTVTGSKILLESNSGNKILIDCGLFQGLKDLRQKNREKLSIKASELEAVVLTHAHLDHSGYIPKLFKDGFRGKIYCSHPTIDLANILLLDSARIQEEDAAYANRKKYSRHKKAKPLYSEKDALNSLKNFEGKDFYESFTVADFKIKLRRAGHILGAAGIYIEVDDKSIYFSGDIGRDKDLIGPSPDPPPKADYLIMESTYGSRLHENLNQIEALKDIVLDVKTNKGVLLIPSFAVGRTQLMLYCLLNLFKKYPELKLPVYLNSPMASNVSQLYCGFIYEQTLSKKECKELCNLARYVNTVSESKQLNERNDSMIIIAGSGMITGGRILHHIRAFGDNPQNAVLLVGYQGKGTRGEALLEGAKELKIHGNYYPVTAKIYNLDVYSAHADQRELVNWLSKAPRPPKTVFLVHGEEGASLSLASIIKEELKQETHIPKLEEEIIL